MAGEKVDHTKVAERMICVWASTIDSLMQQWLEQGKRDDRLGMTITSFKIAQVSMMMQRYFQNVGQEFVEGPTEVKACIQAVEQADTMVRKAMAAAGVGPTVPVTMENDPSVN